jgi:predicted small lipoprotein YifL
MFKRIDIGCILGFSILAALAFSLSGCGRKAPPVPPRRIPPPTVKDLTWQMEENTLKLTWSIPKHAGKRPRRLKGVRVYRSKEPLSEAACLDCPKQFKRVADIPIVEWNDTAEKKEAVMTYSESLEKGYRFIYKVAVYNRDGTTGSDSNTVALRYDNSSTDGAYEK